MELSTREKVFQRGSKHVDTVGVTGSNPVSRTILALLTPTPAQKFLDTTTVRV